MRQAGAWNPLLQCCNACTWTHLSSSNRIQINCMGLKINSCMCSWDKFWTEDTKRPKNPIATFEEPGANAGGSGARAGYYTCPLHTTPPKRWAKHLSHPSGPISGHTPTLTPYKGQARPHLRERASKEIFCLFSLPPAVAGVPIKPHLNFLSGL